MNRETIRILISEVEAGDYFNGKMIILTKEITTKVRSLGNAIIREKLTYEFVLDNGDNVSMSSGKVTVVEREIKDD